MSRRFFLPDTSRAHFSASNPTMDSYQVSDTWTAPGDIKIPIPPSNEHDRPDMIAIGNCLVNCVAAERERYERWASRSVNIDGTLKSSVGEDVRDVVFGCMQQVLELLTQADGGVRAFRRGESDVNASSEKGGKMDLDSAINLLKRLTGAISTLLAVSGDEDSTAGSGAGHGRESPMQGTGASTSISAFDTGFIEHERILIRKPKRSAGSGSGSTPPAYSHDSGTEADRRELAIIGPSVNSSGKSEGKQQTKRLALIDRRSCRGDVPASTAELGGSQALDICLKTFDNFDLAKRPDHPSLLSLVGWTWTPNHQEPTCIYAIPDMAGMDQTKPLPVPRTLLGLLRQHDSQQGAGGVPSLETRYTLALQLALALQAQHSAGLRHGNVDSENVVILFDKPVAQRSSQNTFPSILNQVLRKPYLGGYHRVPNAATPSGVASLYQHPDLPDTPGPDSIPTAEEIGYDFAHDIYSLGVVLLEIGFWIPIEKFQKQHYARYDLLSRMQKELSAKMSPKCGETYMNAVRFCLSAGDCERNMSIACARFGDMVISRLQRCCLLDESSESAIPFTALPIRSALSIPIEASQTSSRSSIAPKKDDNKYTIWSHDVPSLYTDYYRTHILPKLTNALTRLIPVEGSWALDLFLGGATHEVARPTMLVECSHKLSTVKQLLRHLNDEMRLFEIAVARGTIRRSGYSSRQSYKKRSAKAKLRAKHAAVSGKERPNLNPCYQEKPECGASIGAYVDGAHLPPVTFGGIVVVDGTPYGMTVHHMIEEDEQQCEVVRSMGGRERVEEEEESDYASGDEDEDMDWLHEDKPLYPYSITDDSDPELYSEEEDEEEAAHGFLSSQQLDELFAALPDVPMSPHDWDEGDTAGILPGDEHSISITQPALDDVSSGFFPCAEDADEEHLSTHLFGRLHASSGLRRIRSNSLTHEIDWALIEISPSRLPSIPTFPPSILPMSHLPSRKVHCRGRTSGLSLGQVLPQINKVKLSGRSNHSDSFQVRGRFGVGGDSGAWVIDSETGQVCAQVLAYSEARQVTYIAPMEVMVSDMANTLGQSVGLPTGNDAVVEDARRKTVSSYTAQQLSLEVEMGESMRERERRVERENQFTRSRGRASQQTQAKTTTQAQSRYLDELLSQSQEKRRANEEGRVGIAAA